VCSASSLPSPTNRNFQISLTPICRLVFRHLYYDRTEDFVDTLEDYIRQTVGNQYKINIKDIILHRATTNEALEHRKFFCSELVAKAYKLTGLFRHELSCKNFYPANFSTKYKMSLQMGARLGEE